MKQDSLEKLLNEGAPLPNPAARLAARRAALEVFARVNAAATQAAQPSRRGWLQALFARDRLSGDTNSSRREIMPWYSRRLVIGGAASAFIAMFGITLVWNTYRLDPEVARIEPPKEASAPTTSPAETPAVASESASLPAEPAAAEADGAAESARGGAAPKSEPDVAALERKRAELAASAQRAQASAPPQAPDTIGKPGAADEASLAAPASVGPAPPAAPPPAPVDVITAEDIGRFPDAGTAEALQRVPSVVIKQPQDTSGARRMEEEVDNVVVTGARAHDSRSKDNYKAPGPARNGNAPGGLFSRVEKREEPAPPAPPPSREEGRDRFEHFELNSVKLVDEEPVSTFSADVDTSSYSFVRKQLQQGVLPQKDAVRAEEMINYFDYAWPAAEDRQQPFRPTIVVSDSPWGKGRKLVHIGIKGYELPAAQRPAVNLVMLLDVSGSMNSPDKLPLVQQSMKLLLDSLKPTDTVGIVVYAGAAGQVLPPTPVGEKEKIVAALDSLTPGGSTAGAEGIELAYQLAERHFRKEGVNRILLCTDGDFNVGIAGTEQLKGFVERKRETGVFLSVLGFGQGNYRDELAQALAQNGNGVAAYIDSLNEARKVLVQQAGSSLFTIASDVKLQVEFNPATVAEYRLVGYETRALKREDFNNDAIDAGDIGAGHTVTAIYEITPVGVDARMVDESRYTKRRPVATDGTAREYGFLKIRYKLPGERRSKLIEQPIGLGGNATGAAIQRDVEFSTAVAGFAQLLRGGQFTGPLSYDDVIRSALASRGEDPYGHRSEFVQLVRQAQTARGL